MTRYASLLIGLCMPALFAVPPLAQGAANKLSKPNADDLQIVHCLLPGQVRQLGQRATFVSPRQPTRTTALECRVRGGEYVLGAGASLRSALNIWLQAANHGDPQAQTTVGELFEQGLGVAPDPTTAATWYEKAAKQGDTRAMTSLGALYELGRGVPQDPARALFWYRKAAGADATAVQLDTHQDLATATAINEDAAKLRTEIDLLENNRKQLERELAEIQRLLADASSSAHTHQLIDELRQRLADKDEQIAQLMQASTGHEQAQLRISALNSQLAREHQQAESLSSQLEASQASRVELQQALDLQVQALAARESDLDNQLLESQRLVAQIKTLRAQSNRGGSAQALSQGNIAGPSINLVDPEMPTTRGLVKVSFAPSRVKRVVGRVSAPAGLLSLTVNQQEITPNPAGVFVYPLPGQLKEVMITAIDQQGKRADVEFEVRSDTSPQTPTLPNVDLGQYHALLIANSRYQFLPDLTTPDADVAQLEQILRTGYGFRTTVLINATRYQILSALNELRKTLTERDNLLIYYAGHGELDDTNMRGHWLPVDAEPDSTANWVSNVAITDVLNVINARQVMLIADSCYSGTLTRSAITTLDSGLTDAERRTWLELMATKRARVVLTSGGLAPVLDIGGGAHSVFAKALLGVLASNRDLLAGRNLYQAVAARVAHAAAQYNFEQVPQYAPIARAGHETGDFLLLPSAAL